MNYHCYILIAKIETFYMVNDSIFIFLLFGLRTFEAEAKVTVQEIQNTLEGIKM